MYLSDTFTIKIKVFFPRPRFFLFAFWFSRHLFSGLALIFRHPLRFGAIPQELPAKRGVEARPRCQGKGFGGTFRAAGLTPPKLSSDSIRPVTSIFHPNPTIR